MPDVSWNYAVWNGRDAWKAEGEEWSESWGGPLGQWYGTLLPRISRWIPTDSILEIAPGFGRWTRFLLRHASREYYGIDLSPQCIQACIQRFTGNPKNRFIVNDGMSLEMVPDGSIDFVFSFDSLVHVELDVLASYVPQIIRKLTSNGIAFIHHSNAANHHDPTNPHLHARGLTVSSDAVNELIERAEGCTLVQEEIKWGCDYLIDCLSTFCRKESVFAQPLRKIQNNFFMSEVNLIKQFHSAYHTL